MATSLAILGVYFAGVLIIGLVASRRSTASAEDYFLANRSFGPLVLLATIAATNFSAFTIFGCSGEGYRHGLAFIPVMGFGTGFMALTFWIIGRRVWQLGREHGLITPAELVGKLYGNRWARLLFAFVMIVWTVPYLALQPMAGGIVLNQLFGLEHVWGAAIITFVILLYTFRGGMRAVAWTDALQGMLMLVLLVSALVIVANANGGVIAALEQTQALNPALFSRPGALGAYVPGVYFSMIFLWFFCDPMFPQLFQRFMAARSERSIAGAMVAYPLVCAVIFAISITIGTLGNLSFGDLKGKEADGILPMLMTAHAGEIMASLVMVAGLAALMSTMDSQLLTLSSIVVRDILPERISLDNTAKWGRAAVAILAICGFIVAISPAGSIIKIGLLAFTGLAALFPTVLFGLYLKKPSPIASIVSILVGQGILLLYILGMLKASGYLPALPVIVGSIVAYLLVQVSIGIHWRGLEISPRNKWLAAGFTVVFILAMDFWNWGKSTPLILGMPLWFWYISLLSVFLTILMMILVRRRSDRVSQS